MKLNKRFFYGVLTAVALLTAGCSKDNTDPVPDPGTGEQLVENPKVRAAVRTMMSEAARTESTLNGVAVWQELSLIHISEPTRHYPLSRMPSSA